MHPKNELENLFYHFNPNERLWKVLQIFRQTSEGNQKVIREVSNSLSPPQNRRTERNFSFFNVWNVEYQITH